MTSVDVGGLKKAGVAAAAAGATGGGTLGCISCPAGRVGVLSWADSTGVPS